MSYADYIGELVASLKAERVYKIILIGSYARNSYNDSSDIDLVVVLDDVDIPKTYKEKMNIKLRVRRSVYSLSEKIPIDLIVYTKAEYELLRDLKTSFFNEIELTGKTLYEKAS